MFFGKLEHTSCRIDIRVVTPIFFDTGVAGYEYVFTRESDGVPSSRCKSLEGAENENCEVLFDRGDYWPFCSFCKKDYNPSTDSLARTNKVVKGTVFVTIDCTKEELIEKIINQADRNLADNSNIFSGLFVINPDCAVEIAGYEDFYQEGIIYRKVGFVFHKSGFAPESKKSKIIYAVVKRSSSFTEVAKNIYLSQSSEYFF